MKYRGTIKCTWCARQWCVRWGFGRHTVGLTLAAGASLENVEIFHIYLYIFAPPLIPVSGTTHAICKEVFATMAISHIILTDWSLHNWISKFPVLEISRIQSYCLYEWSPPIGLIMNQGEQNDPHSGRQVHIHTFSLFSSVWSQNSLVGPAALSFILGNTNIYTLHYPFVPIGFIILLWLLLISSISGSGRSKFDV